MTATAPAASLERTYALVEKAIGRPLRDAEKAIDVIRLDTALNRAKDELEAAIRAAMLVATKAWVDQGRFGAPWFSLTDAMRRPLEELYRLGREEAALELERLGYAGVVKPDGRKRPRRYAAPDPMPGGDLSEAIATVEHGLPGIAVRVEDELVSMDLTDASSTAIARALLRVPGARDLASRVISTALTSGFAGTFEENADLVGAWEYTAVLDGGTCHVCAPLDGTIYPTLEALFRVLPNFGPNPLCQGGGRCRCRAVPAVPGAHRLPAPALADGPPETPAFAKTADAEAWIVNQGLAREASLGTIAPEGAREVADALSQTFGRSGVTLDRLELDPTSKKSLARYRYRETGRTADRITYHTAIQVKRVVANAKTASARAATEHEKWVRHRDRAAADRERQIGDETRPEPLRDLAREALAKIQAAPAWATWSTSQRPIFSLIAHEAAHALDHQLGLSAAWKTALERHGVSVLDRYAVSEYAASSSAELFAEAVALRAEGRPMPASVQAALEEVLADAGL